jgi:hypothetical protein
MLGMSSVLLWPQTCIPAADLAVLCEPVAA